MCSTLACSNQRNATLYTYIHTYIHACMHTYINIYIYIYVKSFLDSTRMFLNSLNSKVFVETKAAKCAYSYLTETGMVLIEGQPGAGKTTIGMYLLNEVSNRMSRVPLVVTEPQQWYDIPGPGKHAQTKKYVVLVDDIFGKISLSCSQRDSWEQNFEMMRPIIDSGHIQLVMISRSYILSDASVGFIGNLRRVSLTDEPYKLSVEEKEMILKLHVKLYHVEMSEKDIHEACKDTAELGFPQCCKYFVENKEEKNLSLHFFTNPLQYLDEEMDRMKRRYPLGYFVLLLVMFKEGKLTKTYLNPLNEEAKTDIDNMKNYCVKIEAKTIADIIATADNLTGTYLVIDDNSQTYEYIHNSVFDCMIRDFSHDYQPLALEVCTCQMLVDSFTTCRGTYQQKILIAEKHYAALAKRITHELLTGNHKIIANHQSLSHRVFVNFLIQTHWDDETKEKVIFHAIDEQHGPKIKDYNLEHMYGLYMTLFESVSYFDLVRFQSVISLLLLNKHEILVSKLVSKSQHFKSHQDKMMELLTVACYTNAKDMVNKLLQWQCVPNETCLKVASAGEGDYTIISRLLQHKYLKTPSYSVMYWTIRHAFFRCESNIIRVMLSKLQNLSRENNQELLNWAIKHLCFQFSEEYRTSIMIFYCSSLESSKFPVREILDELLSRGAMINMDEALLMAAGHDDPAALQVILQHNPKLNTRDKEGSTPMHKACQFGAVQNVELLIEQRADVLCLNYSGKTPLHYALDVRGEKSALLLRADANVNAVAANGETPLHTAAIARNVIVLKQLLEARSLPTAQRVDKDTPLHVILDHFNFEQRDEDCFAALLQCTSSVNIKGQSGNTPLHLAVELDRAKPALQLIERGACVNEVNDKGNTPLICLFHDNMMLDFGIKRPWNIVHDLASIRMNDTQNTIRYDIMKALLSKGLNINYVNESLTAFHLCASIGNKECVAEFLTNGADVNAVNKDGETPLHIRLSRISTLYPHSHTSEVKEEVENIQFMLDKMTNVNIQDNEGRSAWHCLFDAYVPFIFKIYESESMAVDIEKKLTHLLLEKRVDTKLLDCKKCSVLHHACIVARPMTIRKLIRTGINVNQKDIYGRAAIHTAVTSSFFSTNIDVLVENGADVNLVDDDGFTAVHLALICSNTEALKGLIRNSADINIKDTGNRKTPLHYTLSISVYYNFRYIGVKPMELLLAAKADPSIPNEDGLTFFEAVLSAGKNISLNALLSMQIEFLSKPLEDIYIPLERWKILNTLLEQGFNPDAVNDSGHGPLHISAFRYDCYDRADLLLKHGADPDRPNCSGDVPLHIATKQNNGKLTKLLLLKGADINAVNYDGNTALHICKGKGNYDSATSLLFAPDTPLVTKSRISTQTHFIRRNHVKRRYILRKCPKQEPINVLLEHLENVDQKNKDGDSALHCAAYRGRSHKVVVLLKHGASLSQPNCHGHLPLHCAAKGGQWKTVELIVRYDPTVGVDIQNQNGCSPLHLSSARGHVVTVKKLVEKRANVNLSDKGGNGPIHYAAQFGKSAVVAVLLDSGADMNMQNDDGHTALHVAVANVKVRVVKLLLRKGVDRSACNTRGRTAGQLAGNHFTRRLDLTRKTGLQHIQHLLS